MLGRVLKIYFASSRRNDFSGAHNFDDLWLFDEFHDVGQESSLVGATETGTVFANTLLKVFFGQQCRLDSKYGRVFTKEKNVPIIMRANKIPSSMQKRGPLQERKRLRLRFSTNLDDLKVRSKSFQPCGDAYRED